MGDGKPQLYKPVGEYYVVDHFICKGYIDENERKSPF